MVKQRLLIVILLALGLVVGGQALARPTDQAATTLRIGFIGKSNSDLARGLQLAVNEINSVGGVDGPNGVTYAFEVIYSDVDSPDAVPSAVQSLITQQVTAIYGPDSADLVNPNVDVLSSAAVPILAVVPEAVLQGQDPNFNLFGLVAPDRDYDSALARYLLGSASATSVVVVQVGLDFSTNVESFNTALTQLGTQPLQIIQVAGSNDILGNIQNLPQTNPSAVVIYSTPEDAVTIMGDLRSRGYGGRFVYRNAQRSLGVVGFDSQLVAGVLGADSWTFGANDPVGSQFIANYVGQFGAAPGALSVASYDSFYALSRVIANGGPAPNIIRQLLPQFSSQNLVRGPINPAFYGNRILSRTVLVYELTGFGGAQAVAAYDNGIQRADFGATPVNPPAAATPTLAPTFTPSPAPSATPSVVTGTVTSAALNVRSGPGTQYDRVFQLDRGDQVTISGRNGDFSWYFIQYQGQVGWATAEFLDIFDPGNLVGLLPLIPDPATPTPAPTQVPQDADLIITSITLSPSQPVAGAPVSATVTIRNQGGADAGGFAVAASFRPGEIYSAQNLGGLAAGQSVTTTLTATIIQTGYVPDQAFVVDLNNEVFEGAAGETNNIYTMAYKVDRQVAILTQSALVPGQSLNLYGPNVDLSWDGGTLTMVPGAARIGFVVGETFETAHYGQVATFATSTNYGNPQPGNLFAVITEEGYYGFLRIDNRDGANNLTVSYRIYVP